MNDTFDLCEYKVLIEMAGEVWRCQTAGAAGLAPSVEAQHRHLTIAQERFCNGSFTESSKKVGFCAEASRVPRAEGNLFSCQRSSAGRSPGSLVNIFLRGY